MSTKTYVTTDKAGWRVAGRVVPAAPAVKNKVPQPLAGHPIDLTDDEAEYELRQGTIMLKPPASPAAIAAPSKSV